MQARHHHPDHLKLYLTVFVALMGLLILTVCVYYIPFEKWRPGGVDLSFMNTALALTIAITKALLVMLIFMHLKDSPRLVWITASAGFIWLGIMITFTFADFRARGTVPEALKTPVSMIRATPLEH